MLGRTLKMAFWVSFDHLGKLLIANVFSVCLVLLPLVLAHAAFVTGHPGTMIYVSLPLVVVGVVIAFPLAQAGLIYLTRELIEKHDGSLMLYFYGIRRFIWPLIRLAIFYVLALSCLSASVFFYGYRTAASLPLVGYGLSAVALWLLIFLLLSALFAAPAAAYKKTGVLQTVKISLLLVVDNPLFAVGLCIHVAILCALALLPPVLLLFSFSPIVVLQCSAYEILSRKYQAIQAHKSQNGTRLKVKNIDFGDEDDEYLCRGVRDLLFPWKE